MFVLEKGPYGLGWLGPESSALVSGWMYSDKWLHSELLSEQPSRTSMRCPSGLVPRVDPSTQCPAAASTSLNLPLSRPMSWLEQNILQSQPNTAPAWAWAPPFSLVPSLSSRVLVPQRLHETVSISSGHRTQILSQRERTGPGQSCGDKDESQSGWSSLTIDP